MCRKGFGGKMILRPGAGFVRIRPAVGWPAGFWMPPASRAASDLVFVSARFRPQNNRGLGQLGPGPTLAVNSCRAGQRFFVQTKKDLCVLFLCTLFLCALVRCALFRCALFRRAPFLWALFLWALFLCRAAWRYEQT